MAVNESREILDLTFPANADLSTKQFYPVKLLTTGKVDVCSAAADITIGVLQNTPSASGRSATVRILGLSKVAADGSGTTIAVGDMVGTNSAGLAVQKATAGYSTIGMAITGSTSATSLISVLVFPRIVTGTAGG